MSGPREATSLEISTGYTAGKKPGRRQITVDELLVFIRAFVLKFYALK